MGLFPRNEPHRLLGNQVERLAHCVRPSVWNIPRLVLGPMLGLVVGELFRATVAWIGGWFRSMFRALEAQGCGSFCGIECGR